MSTRTLVEISPEPRTWDSQYGQMAAFRLTFEDGMKAELVTKAETVEKRRAELKAALGHPGEWVLEDQGAFPDGKAKPQKVTGYPGKPQAPQGRGGGGGLSFEDRLKLDEATSEHMDVRTAGTGKVPESSAPTRNVEAPAAASQRPGGAPVRPAGSSTSSPVQGRGTAAAGEGAYREAVPSQAADSGAGIPSAPAAVTTPAGDPSPPRVEAPAEPGDGQRGATVIPPSPGTTPEKCSHPSWKPAPRAGFELCMVCGHAEKRKASV